LDLSLFDVGNNSLMNSFEERERIIWSKQHQRIHYMCQLGILQCQELKRLNRHMG
jgi:hypothetical protein